VNSFTVTLTSVAAAALPVEPRLWKDPRGLAHEVGLFLAHEHDDDQEESS